MSDDRGSTHIRRAIGSFRNLPPIGMHDMEPRCYEVMSRQTDIKHGSLGQVSVLVRHLS